MKHLFTAAAMLLSMTAFAQVGINNTSPKATLDITAKTLDGSKPEGMIIPQLSGSNIHTATAAGVYGTNQKGLIIYATSADSSPISATANITAAGYYYFDGGAWQKMTGESAIDATTTSKGIVQLAGDLTGSASSPNITSNAVTNSKIADNAVTTSKLLDNSVTVAKLPSGATGTTFLRGDGTWATPDATNIYNSDGTLIGTRTVNTAGNSLRISGGGQLVVQTADNSGKIRLSPADTSHTGYMEVIKGDNTRLGYIGWDNTNILYNVENGASHIFGVEMWG